MSPADDFSRAAHTDLSTILIEALVRLKSISV